MCPYRQTNKIESVPIYKTNWKCRFGFHDWSVDEITTPYRPDKPFSSWDKKMYNEAYRPNFVCEKCGHCKAFNEATDTKNIRTLMKFYIVMRLYMKTHEGKIKSNATG